MIESRIIEAAELSDRVDALLTESDAIESVSHPYGGSPENLDRDYSRDCLYDAAETARGTRVQIPLTPTQRQRVAVAVSALLAVAAELDAHSE